MGLYSKPRFFDNFKTLSKNRMQDQSSILNENQHLHEVERLLKRKSAFQALLMKISNEYINIPLDRANEAINHSLKEIGTFVDADRSYIFDYNHQEKNASNTFEYCSEGITPEIDNLQQIPYDMIPDWISYHFDGKLIYIPEVNKLPEGNLRDLLSSQGIQSLITIPMMDGPTCLGFIGFDAVKNTRVYTDEEIDLLKLYSQMLINLHLRTRKENEVNEVKAKLEKTLEREIELNRMKSNFITMTSHQFRSPLTTIQASADLLKMILAKQQPEGNSKLEKHIGRIFTEVERINNLMNEVRFLGKATTDNIPFEPSPVDVVALVDHLIAGNSILPGDFRIPTVKINGIPQPIQADERLLTQAFSHLLNNALKFSTGKPEPEVNLNFSKDALSISITDQGIGIPERDIENLFTSFSRASNVENINGTGLGLAITKHIIEMHKGDIRLTSTEGQGTKVEIDLKVQD